MTTSRQADEASSSVNSYLKVSECVMQTFRKNKSKMKNLTEAELRATLKRGLELVDQPFPDIDFDQASFDLNLELNFDDDFDDELWATPSVTAEARPAPTPSTTSSSRSKSITIRVPAIVLAAIKAKAKEKGIAYQTLMNRSLRLAVVS